MLAVKDDPVMCDLIVEVPVGLGQAARQAAAARAGLPRLREPRRFAPPTGSGR